MIIDAHSHAYDESWLPDWTWRTFSMNMAPRHGITPEAMMDIWRKSWDISGDTMIKGMDHAGVDRAVICVLDFGLAAPGEDAATPIEEINRLTYEMVKRHPDRLYYAVGVDPRRKNALEIVERGIKEWDARSLKLHPGTGWFPNDTSFYPLYKKCLEYGVPVNFHTGPWSYPLRAKYCQPLVFDEVAADFPDLIIQCTHAGDLSYMEMASIARVRKNMVLDLAGWLRWLRTSRTTALSFYQTLRFLMDNMGPRLMFASDWSGLIIDRDYCDWVNAFRQVPEWVREAGIEFTRQEMDGFLGGNAQKLLRLGSAKLS